MNKQPQFPLYIPSKGRYDIMLTSNYLTEMRVKHHIIVEEQEYELYKNNTEANEYVKLLILDKKFQDEYNTLDDLGASISKGSGAARNFAWEHSIKEGYTWHWVMDDNIRSFQRWNNNKQVKVDNGTFFIVMEDFALRYKNISMLGPQYMMFAPRKLKLKPFVFNTRVYSCNLIRNDVPYRWTGRYNEDTILSLNMLKDGWVTILFNAMLQEKMKTLSIKGGNTTDIYANGARTLEKSKQLCEAHPDVSRVVWKYGRWHHHVDYTPFKSNKLIRREDIDWDNLPETNEYGLSLVKKDK